MTSFSNAELCSLFEQIESAGASLSLSGGKLRAVNGIGLAPEIVDEIRCHKDLLIHVLSRSVGVVCPHCSAGQIAVPTFDGYENFECFKCGKCSGCRRAAT